MNFFIYFCSKLTTEQYKITTMRTTEPKTEPSPASEAYRYVANAKETLDKKAKLNSDYQAYEDRKYVRAAGHYLWLSVLIMLEAKYHLKKNKRSRVDIDDYKLRLTNDDKKLLSMVNRAYDIMHLNMGYDGVQDKIVCSQGIHLANEIIDRCERHIIPKQE